MRLKKRLGKSKEARGMGLQVRRRLPPVSIVVGSAASSIVRAARSPDSARGGSAAEDLLPLHRAQGGRPLIGHLFSCWEGRSPSDYRIVSKVALAAHAPCFTNGRPETEPHALPGSLVGVLVEVYSWRGFRWVRLHPSMGEGNRSDGRIEGGGIASFVSFLSG